MEPVSVIIPTYNRAGLLRRAVESVLQQRDFNGEIIIVDDGSADDTKVVVETLINDRAGQNHDIRYCCSANGGPAAARNRGVDLSAHSYIAFLDSDDHWHRDKLSRQMEMMRLHPQYSICHTGEKWLRRGQHLNQKKIHKPRHGYIFDHCLRLCAVGMSTVVLKKDIFLEFKGFDVSLPCCEDYDFWLRVSSRHDFLLVPDPLIVKEGGRVDQLSYIHRVGMDKYRIYALEKLLRQYTLTAEQYKNTVSELKRKCRVYGNGCIRHGRLQQGRKYLDLPDQYIFQRPQ